MKLFLQKIRLYHDDSISQQLEIPTALAEIVQKCGNAPVAEIALEVDVKNNVEAAVPNGSAFDFGHVQSIQEEFVQDSAQAAGLVGNGQHHGNHRRIFRHLHVLGDADELGEVRDNIGNTGSQNL